MSILPRVGSTLGCCAALVLAGMVVGASAGAKSGPPPGATPVHVAAGVVTSGIDATLEPTAGGSISGRVLENGSRKPLDGVIVSVTNPADNTGYYIGDTGSDGSYTVSGLKPLSTGYHVCFVSNPGGDRAAGGDSTTGWVPECYRGVVWAGQYQPRPAQATPVPLAAGEHVSGIGARLRPAAAIAGTVRGAGHRLGRNVRVIVHSQSAPHYRKEFRTNQRSHFTVRDLPPSAAGYRICFAMASFHIDATHSPTGLLPQCYHSHGSSAVHLPLGKLRTGIDADLRIGGAVSGTVTDRADGSPVHYADVEVYDSSGTRIAGDSTNARGYYKVVGLPAAKADRVCVRGVGFYPAHAYQRTCSPSVPWTGRAARRASAKVGVAIGALHKGVDVRLRRGPTISGTVTSATTHHPRRGLYVAAYDRTGAFVDSISTDRDGHYELRHLQPSDAGYLLCVDVHDSGYSGDPAGTGPGLAPRCASGGSWDGLPQDLPSDATYLTLSGQQHRRGVDIELPAGGGISGITASDTHSPLSAAQAIVFDKHGHTIAKAGADDAGRYTVTGLDPSHAYRVCFRDGSAVSECYHGVPWTDQGRGALRNRLAGRAALPRSVILDRPAGGGG